METCELYEYVVISNYEYWKHIKGKFSNHSSYDSKKPKNSKFRNYNSYDFKSTVYCMSCALLQDPWKRVKCTNM
jgi:hypothetical protein